MGVPQVHVATFLLSFCVFFNFLSPTSHAVDTIKKDQSIKDGQTLVSTGKSFVLGFFSPPKSKNRYVGIWYYKVSIQTVVWVANRENPVTDSSGILTIKNDGNLMIVDGKPNTIWSTNVSTSSNATIAQLMDSGNLILRKIVGDEDDDETNLWESFDYPTDTFLPSMKVGLDLRTGFKWLYTSWRSPDDPSPGNFSFGIDPRGVAQFFMWKNSVKYWRSGLWNWQSFMGMANSTPLYLYGFRLAYVNQNGKTYFTYSVLNSSLILRFVTTWDGRNEQLKWEEKKQRWVVYAQEPSTCQIYGRCGEFGSCHDQDSPTCSCLRGFKPKFDEEWSIGKWDGGCVRRTQLECGSRERSEGKGDGFMKLDGVKLPDLSDWLLVKDEKECEEKCLKNCSCRAYAYISTIGCLTWGRNLVDMQQLSGGPALFIRLAHSELGEKKETLKSIKIVVTTVGVISFSIVAFFLWRFLRNQKDVRQDTVVEELSFDWSIVGEGSSSKELGAQPAKTLDLPLFSFKSMAAATNGFSYANKLGEGGFGPVYRGMLPGGQQIAVKRLSRRSGQGLEELKNEILLIAKLQHRNLVRILGCCIEGEEKMLMYEYMPNRSLDSFLFDPTKKTLLDWAKRFNIIQGIARGLLYLHQDSRLRIIHRDLKASNILIDEEMNPKISDFGMARIFGGDQNQSNTTRVVGTYGYMAPEYALEGLFSVKSDVYSFGVLLLEIVTGKRNSIFHHGEDCLSLLGYAWRLWDEGKAMDLIDPSLGDSYLTSEVLRSIEVALLCVQDRPMDRPTMDYVVLMLWTENTVSSIPKEPSFYRSRTSRETVYMPQFESFCTNDATVNTIAGQ